MLLQVMDHGKLTDHNGKQVDFRNVILIMTTNAGASDLARQAYGFTRSKREGDDLEAINKMFAPEFRNRLDATITFAHLSQEIIAKVVEKFVLQLEAQLGDRNVTIELSEEASRWLIANGYDELMGARPMARVIQEHIKSPGGRGAVRSPEGRWARARDRRQRRRRSRQARLPVPRRSGHAEAGKASGGAAETEAALLASAQGKARVQCRKCRWRKSRFQSNDRKAGLVPGLRVLRRQRM